MLTWPAAVRHLDAESPWLAGLFDGRTDPRLALVGHASLRHHHEYREYTVRTGELIPIVAALAHHLDPAFDAPDVVLEKENNIVSAYGCGGGNAWEKRGNERCRVDFDSSATEHAAGMSSEDRWTAHGLPEGSSLAVHNSDSFGGSFEFEATGYAPAIFEVAAAWQSVLRGATLDEVRAQLTDFRAGP